MQNNQLWLPWLNHVQPAPHCCKITTQTPRHIKPVGDDSFPGLCSTSWKHSGHSSENSKWKIVLVPIFPPRGETVTEMRCDCDKHPDIRATHDKNFNSLRQTSSKWLSVRKKTSAACIQYRYNMRQQPQRQKRWNKIWVISWYKVFTSICYFLLFYYFLCHVVVKANARLQRYNASVKSMLNNLFFHYLKVLAKHCFPLLLKENLYSPSSTDSCCPLNAQQPRAEPLIKR